MNIVLYQIIPELDIMRLMFNGLEYIKESCGDKIPAGFYEIVFSGDIEAKTCEDVFTIFNVNHPQGYKGRSMSVSDVLEIIDSSGKSEFFFCDSVGFKSIDFNKEGAMTVVLNRNYDLVHEKRKNVSIFFMNETSLEQVICKEVLFTRCQYSETQLGYMILCETKRGTNLKYEFLERPTVIISNCLEKFPLELLYIDDKKMRYTVHDKENLGIVCTWLLRKGYSFENFDEIRRM